MKFNPQFTPSHEYKHLPSGDDVEAGSKRDIGGCVEEGPGSYGSCEGRFYAFENKPPST
jgi:hypothetical protein